MTMPRRFNVPAAMGVSNILDIYDRASAAEVAEGAVWYAEARAFADELAHRYGISRARAVGVIAALSPRCEWGENKRLAESYVRARTIENRIPEGPGDLGCLQASVDAASRVWDGATLTGLKVSQFARNIAGDTGGVCVDSHASALWYGRPDVVVHGLGTVSRYGMIADDYRSAAVARGISPAAMQAVTWIVWRRLYSGTAKPFTVQPAPRSGGKGWTRRN